MSEILFFFQRNEDYIDESFDSAFKKNKETCHYYEKKKGSCFKDCSTYNVAIAKSIIKTNKFNRFDIIVYAYDDYYEENIWLKLNNAVDEELTDLIYDKNNIIKVKYCKSWNSEKVINEICDKAPSMFKENNNVYIATNSGLRNNVMFFSTFAQILKCRKVTTYLYYEHQNEIITENEKGDLLINYSDDLKYYDVLRGVELFTETGNPKKLKDCFKEEIKKDPNSELNKLFKNMISFYEKIQVCRKIEKNQDKDNSNAGVVDTFIKLKEQLKSIDNNQSNLPISLKLLIPKIRSSFHCTNKVQENQEGHDIHEGKELIPIVEWCSDNGLVTVAYFILRVELMEFFIKNNIIVNSSEENEDIKCIEKLVNRYALYISNNNAGNKKKIYDWFEKEENYKAIQIWTLVRKIRNSIAHSSDTDPDDESSTDVLFEHDCYYAFLLPLLENYSSKRDKSEDPIENMFIINKNNRKTISPSADNYYMICQQLLPKIIKDLKKLSNY